MGGRHKMGDDESERVPEVLSALGRRVLSAE